MFVKQNVKNPKALLKCAEDYTEHATFCNLVAKTLEVYNLKIERAGPGLMKNQILRSVSAQVQVYFRKCFMVFNVEFSRAFER
jgi:hypothetical protein